MAVFRVERTTGYTVMSNHHLRNKNLSLKAKGLLSQMLSLPEDWDFTLAGLSYINWEKIDAIREGIHELEKAGYVVRTRERDDKGRLCGADYIIYEQPQQPESDFPVLENLQERRKEHTAAAGTPYYDNDLVISKPDGAPYRRDVVSNNFGQLVRHLEMPHIRFHDLRHTAATNMHQLTGDFYTVGEILGHTLKGIGMSLGISTNLEAVTAQYVDVRLERKKSVLDVYHKALHPPKGDGEKKLGDGGKEEKPKKKVVI